MSIILVIITQGYCLIPNPKYQDNGVANILCEQFLTTKNPVKLENQTTRYMGTLEFSRVLFL